MGAIDQVKAHFNKLGRRCVEVPEWAADDGKPMLIYSAPQTLSEKQKLINIQATQGQMAMLAHFLILKAEDVDGKKLFTLEDKHALMNGSAPEVLSRVVDDMNSDVSIEDQEKN